MTVEIHAVHINYMERKYRSFEGRKSYHVNDVNMFTYNHQSKWSSLLNE